MRSLNSASAIRACRICGNSRLEPLLDLGEQTLTGIFPRHRTERVPSGPLELVKCEGKGHETSCGLVQLRHSYDGSLLYGENYGYRSGLNSSMVRHLQGVVEECLQRVSPSRGDLVIDIGSNDGTLLRLYPNRGCRLVGIDPTIAKFKRFYTEEIEAIPECFSSALVRERFGRQRAKIITSIAMFYDLEDPVGFAREIAEVLDDEGIWVLEQSYMPLMVRLNMYDTICHEHLEYYGIRQVLWILDRAGLKIVDLSINDANGGSFRLTVAKGASRHPACGESLRRALADEDEFGSCRSGVFDRFRAAVIAHKTELTQVLRDLKQRGKKVLGYGASTKGNVILQHCGLSEADLPYIAEVNEDKFGCYTPGTLIPILSETEARSMRPDYFLVLPWHFRENILKRERTFLEQGGGLIFPLPRVEVYAAR